MHERTCWMAELVGWMDGWTDIKKIYGLHSLFLIFSASTSSLSSFCSVFFTIVVCVWRLSDEGKSLKNSTRIWNSYIALDIFISVHSTRLMVQLYNKWPMSRCPARWTLSAITITQYRSDWEKLTSILHIISPKMYTPTQYRIGHRINEMVIELNFSPTSKILITGVRYNRAMELMNFSPYNIYIYMPWFSGH